MTILKCRDVEGFRRCGSSGPNYTSPFRLLAVSARCASRRAFRAWGFNGASAWIVCHVHIHRQLQGRAASRGRYWLRHDVNAHDNRHADCIVFFTACPIHSKCISPRCRRCFAFLQFLVFRVAETSVFAAFSCLRVVNTSKFRVFPVFGSLFTGVQVGKERIHSRNLVMRAVHCDVGKGETMAMVGGGDT